MATSAIKVELDTTRTLVFNHQRLRELDDDLGKYYDTCFFDWVSKFMEFVDAETGEVSPQAMSVIRMGIINLAYMHALEDPNTTLEDAESILDEADVSFGDLVNHLIEAHPYLQSEELEDTDASDREASGDPLEA